MAERLDDPPPPPRFRWDWQEFWFASLANAVGTVLGAWVIIVLAAVFGFLTLPGSGIVISFITAVGGVVGAIWITIIRFKLRRQSSQRNSDPMDRRPPQNPG
jgi:hypothetical protein